MTAQLLESGRIVSETPMRYAGEVSTFEGEIALESIGELELRVLASQADEANAGLSSVPISIR